MLDAYLSRPQHNHLNQIALSPKHPLKQTHHHFLKHFYNQTQLYLLHQATLDIFRLMLLVKLLQWNLKKEALQQPYIVVLIQKCLGQPQFLIDCECLESPPRKAQPIHQLFLEILSYTYTNESVLCLEFHLRYQ